VKWSQASQATSAAFMHCQKSTPPSSEPTPPCRAKTPVRAQTPPCISTKSLCAPHQASLHQQSADVKNVRKKKSFFLNSILLRISISKGVNRLKKIKAILVQKLCFIWEGLFKCFLGDLAKCLRFSKEVLGETILNPKSVSILIE